MEAEVVAVTTKQGSIGDGDVRLRGDHLDEGWISRHLAERGFTMVDATTESGICAHVIRGDSRRCAGCGRDLRGADLHEARRRRALERRADEQRRSEQIAEELRPASAKLAQALHTLMMMPGAEVP